MGAAQVLDDRLAFRSVVGQRGQQRAFGQLPGCHARRGIHRRATTVTEGDGAGLVQQQDVHVPRRFHRTTGLGDHVQAHQTIHTGDTDGRQQAADGGRNQGDQQRHQEHQRQAAVGEVSERLQGDDHQQEDQGQADQQNIERHFVRGFLALGAFDQGDHAVQGRLTGVGGNLHQQPVGHQPRVAGDGRTVATGLANHGGRFTGNRRFVDCRDAFDHLAVTGDHLPGFDAHHIALAQTRGRHDLEGAIAGFAPGAQAFATGLEAVGTGLAAAFGQGFGKVGEQHGEPQPQGNLRGDEGRYGRIGNEAQHGGQDRRQFDHQHHRRTLQLPRVELDEGLHQRRAPEGRDRGFCLFRRLDNGGFCCGHIHHQLLSSLTQKQPCSNVQR
ncbi:hypothetical protein D9M73_139770 [compost metagenome]